MKSGIPISFKQGFLLRFQGQLSGFHIFLIDFTKLLKESFQILGPKNKTVSVPIYTVFTEVF